MNAVHEAPTASLHTPYIRPSENGSRSGVYWMQLNDGKYKYKIKKGPRESFQDNQRSPETKTTGDTKSSAVDEPTKLKEAIGEAKDGCWGTTQETCPFVASGFANNRGCAITVRSSKLFNFSLQEYSTEALSIASHSTALDSYTMQIASCAESSSPEPMLEPNDYKLPNCRRGLSLNIDPFLMGVGGDDSWSACVHEEFTLHPALYSFKVSMSFHYR